MLSMRVEAQIGVGVFEQNARDMVIFADKLNICVTADWNGVDMIVMPGMTPDMVVKMYHSLNESKNGAVQVMLSFYLAFLRWKYRVLAHDGSFTRTLQHAAARGKGWA